MSSCNNEVKYKNNHLQGNTNHYIKQEKMPPKYAGISPESVQCVAEQVITEQLSSEACSALAEDVTYRLRQLIHNITLHAQHTRRHKISVDDVNTVLRLMDVEPIVGPQLPRWLPLGDAENLCVPADSLVDVLNVATQQQSFYTVQPPSLSSTWVLDDMQKDNNIEISSTLQNYFSKICKAILSGNKKLSKVALNDVRSNTRIGLIIPNFFNLSILVLSEECMSVMAPDTHQTLQVQALNLLEYIFVNPCCHDTDISSQLQRLFTILISNILTESTLSDKMCKIISSLCTIWPQFAHIGRTIVLEYLAQGIQERLSSSLVMCLSAMGRKALYDGLYNHLEIIESIIYGNIPNIFCPRLYEAILDTSHVFLGGKHVKYSPELVHIDEMLYEILGDSLLPKRYHLLMIEKQEEKSQTSNQETDRQPHSPLRGMKKPKLRIIKTFPVKNENGLFSDNVFESHNYRNQRLIYFNFPGCRQLEVQNKRNFPPSIRLYNNYSNGNTYSKDRKISIPLANGLLCRFKYKLPYVKKPTPNYMFYTI